MGSDEGVRRKLGALLRLAKDAGATPAEAASAAEKAQAIADKYRIDLAEALSEEDRDTVVGIKMPKSNAAPWRSVLWNLVSRANGCMIVRIRSPKGFHIFGHPGDIEIVAYLATYLETLLDGMSSEAHRQHKRAEGQWAVSSQQFKQSWCLGASAAIEAKLMGNLRQTTARGLDGESQYGLVPVSSVQAAKDEVYPHLRPGRALRYQADAFADGYRAGQALELRRGLTHKPNQLR